MHEPAASEPSRVAGHAEEVRAETYVVTLKLDEPSFERLDGLRRRYFPAALNRVPTHLTLLHRLDETQVAHLLDMRTHWRAEPAVALEFLSVRGLGRGVAMEVLSSGLQSLRSAVVTLAGGSLIAQDRQKFRPHVTIQNKVSTERARQTLEAVTAQFVPWRGAGRGLLVWRYLGGPWGLAHELPFAWPT